MTSIVVLVGAGASYDCASPTVAVNNSWRPPLVKDLFSTRLSVVLNQYPLVQAAAADIRRVTAPDAEDAVQLEQFLRETMRASRSPYTQRRYAQVPLYLQPVMHTVSTNFTSEPDNYNALLNAVLELDDVLFLSLNYDTLLDGRLAIYSPIDSLDSYIHSDPQWALVKLHGSADWARPIVLEDGPNSTGQLAIANSIVDSLPRAILSAARPISFHPAGDLSLSRYDLHTRTLYYPALALPLGEEDELVCPDEHVEEARTRLARMDGLNILVLGYSGIDTEVLRLLAEAGQKVKTLRIVNGDFEMGQLTLDRISSALRLDVGSDRSSIFAGGFTDAVTTGDLQKWVRSLT